MILLEFAGINRSFYLFASDPLHIELYADSKKVAGTKISLPGVDMRFSTKEAEKFNLGISLSSKMIFPKLPVTVKAGNLSPGGMLSYLKNPEIGTGTSPFSSGTFTPCLMTASLAGYSVFSKEMALFMQIESKGNSFFNNTLNCLFSNEFASPVLSLQSRAQFLDKRLKFYLSFIGGEFYYEDNYKSSWFLDNVYYDCGSHFCMMNQFSTEYKSKVSKFMILYSIACGLYESPFSTFLTNYRSDVKIQSRHTDIYASAFYNPKEGLITSSDKVLSSSAQFKLGFDIKYLAGRRLKEPFILKNGINGICKINLLNEEYLLFVNAGCQISSSLTAVSFTASGKLNIEGFEELSFNLKNNLYFNKVNLAFSLQSSYDIMSLYIEENQSKYKAGINFSTNGRGKLSGGGAFSFALKNGEVDSKKILANISYNRRIFFTSVILKAGIDLSL